MPVRSFSYCSIPLSDGRTLLTGKTIILRNFEREDLKDLHRWQDDEAIMRLARSFPDHTISREALEARYEKAIKGGDFGERYYIIEEKSSREPIGWTSLDIHGWTRRAGWANLRSGGPRTDKYRAGVRTKGTR